MYSLKRAGFSLLLLLLTACAGPGPSEPPTSLPTAPPLISTTAAPLKGDELPTAPPATASALPALPVAPPTLTPVPTATRPIVRPISLALPDFIATEAADLAAWLPDTDVWDWRLSFVAEPAAALATGAADMALLPNDAGIPVADRPVILAVPFTTEWEFIDSATARQIISDGHNLAVALDWSALPPGHKALRVDGFTPADPAYPLQTTWSISASPGLETAARQAASALATKWAAPQLVHLVAVGDIMLDRALGHAINQGSIDFPFAAVVERLQAGDITVGNMESALGDIGAPAPKSYAFQAPPAAAQSLAQAGFDVVSLANNHAMDFGPEALRQGFDLLSAAGVQPVGAGIDDATAHAPYVTTVNGLRLAFLGYVNVPLESRSGFDTSSWTAGPDSPGLAWAEPAAIAADVAAIRPAVDHVIVLLHSGFEYQEPPSQPQQTASRAAIDAGATLVIGHHAHILQGVEYYNDGVIVYGLGNFAFEIDGPPETALLNVWLDAGGVRQIEFVPAIVQFGGQPRLALPSEATAIRARVYALTRVLNPVRSP